MAKLICMLMLFAAGGNCFAQYSWTTDRMIECVPPVRNPYVGLLPVLTPAVSSAPPIHYDLVDGDAAARRSLADLFIHSQAQPIYAHNKKGYAEYASYVTSQYTKRYELDSKQSKILLSGLWHQYNKSGTKAVYVHHAVEELLNVWLNGEQMAKWRQLKQYPEYDPYYLEMGRGWNIYNQ